MTFFTLFTTIYYQPEKYCNIYRKNQHPNSKNENNNICVIMLYSRSRAVRVCATRKPIIFRPGPLLKTPLFRPGPLRKTPLFKNIHLFVPLFGPGLLQKVPLLKNIRFFFFFFFFFFWLFLVPKSPHFSVRAPLKATLSPPPIFSEGPLPKPPPPIFKLWTAQ